jgi:hypothetical protein
MKRHRGGLHIEIDTRMRLRDTDADACEDRWCVLARVRRKRIARYGV